MSQRLNTELARSLALALDAICYCDVKDIVIVRIQAVVGLKFKLVCSETTILRTTLEGYMCSLYEPGPYTKVRSRRLVLLLRAVT